MRALDVNGAVLVGEPVDERMAELVLGDKGAAGRAAEHENVEPADMVGDDQRMRLKRDSGCPRARAADPGRGPEESWRPWRAAEKRLRDDMNRAEDSKQADQPRNSRGCSPVQADGWRFSGRG